MLAEPWEGHQIIKLPLPGTERNMDSASSDEKSIRAILAFWFEEISPETWFKKDALFDDMLMRKFERIIEQALAGQLDKWAQHKDGRLALILLLDQMTRNIFRDTPKAYSGDEIACALSLRSVADGFLEIERDMHKRQFFLMPMMHSEDLEIQKQSLPLFQTLTPENTYEYAIRHHDIIERFGRFPHRNQILNRPSSNEELAFLKQQGSSF